MMAGACRLVVYACLVSGLSETAAVASSTMPTTPITTTVWDNVTQAFIDDNIVESMDGLMRTMNVPAFNEVVLQPSLLPAAPWEAGFALEILGTSVVRVPLGATLRMYYTLRWAALNAAGVPISHVKATSDMYLIAIAESTDGVTWSKPLLDRPFSSPLNGANVTRSNILGTALDTTLSATSTIWVEPNALAGRQWWAVSSSHHELSFSASADGISWKRLTQISVPPIPHVGGGVDSQPIVLWDPGCSCHALFTRVDSTAVDTWQKERKVRRVNLLGLNDNFQNDSGTVSVGQQAVVLQADEVDYHTHHVAIAKFPAMGFYGTTAWVREYGSGHRSYFMAPVRYWHWQGWDGRAPARQGEGGEPATYDVPLVVSRTGWNFTYIGGRQPFARPTREGTVGTRQMWVAPPIELGDDELFYVTRGNMNEDGEVGNISTPTGSRRQYRAEVALGRLRRDGIVSIDAQYGTPGTLVTKALNLSGASVAQKLFLNCDASGGGAITVTIRSVTGKLLLGPSMPISYSSTNARVEWPIGNATAGGGGMAVLGGKEIMLFFVVEEAKLYSFRISS